MAVAPRAPAARARAAPARIQAASGTQVIQVFSKEKLVRPKITVEKNAPRILARVQVRGRRGCASSALPTLAERPAQEHQGP